MAFVCCFLLSSLNSYAKNTSNDVRKIVHDDGTIEYTNVIDKKDKNVVYTSHKSRKTATIYKYQDASGVMAFSDKTPLGIRFEVLKVKCFACDPESRVNWHTTRLNVVAFKEVIALAADNSGVDPALLRALIHAESGFNPAAVSSQGAQGLMQLMPATAAELGVVDALNAEQNIRGGARYIARLLKLFKGDIRLASAAYNAGPGAVKKYAGVPPYKETKTYVKRVGILHQRYQQAMSL